MEILFFTFSAAVSLFSSTVPVLVYLNRSYIAVIDGVFEESAVSESAVSECAVSECAVSECAVSEYMQSLNVQSQNVWSHRLSELSGIILFHSFLIH